MEFYGSIAIASSNATQVRPNRPELPLPQQVGHGPINLIGIWAAQLQGAARPISGSASPLGLPIAISYLLKRAVLCGVDRPTP
jgi:hypothetical protein